MALRPDGKQTRAGRYDGVVVLIDEATGKAAQIGPASRERNSAPKLSPRKACLAGEGDIAHGGDARQARVTFNGAVSIRSTATLASTFRVRTAARSVG
jgi:hypothetical protein